MHGRLNAHCLASSPKRQLFRIREVLLTRIFCVDIFMQGTIVHIGRSQTYVMVFLINSINPPVGLLLPNRSQGILMSQSTPLTLFHQTHSFPQVYDIFNFRSNVNIVMEYMLTDLDKVIKDKSIQLSHAGELASAPSAFLALTKFFFAPWRHPRVLILFCDTFVPLRLANDPLIRSADIKQYMRMILMAVDHCHSRWILHRVGSTCTYYVPNVFLLLFIVLASDHQVVRGRAHAQHLPCGRVRQSTVCFHLLAGFDVVPS